MFKYYRSLGFSVVRGQLKDKPPLGKWKKYQTEFPSDTEIENWTKDAEVRFGGNPQIGVVTGSLSKVVVLDVDSKEGWDLIAERNYHLPPTTAVVTSPGTPDNPRGKVHFYYRHPGGIVPTKVKFLPGIDSRGDGGYAMLPPSKHVKHGHRYEWMYGCTPEEAGFVSPPEWFLRAVGHRITVQVSETDLLPRDTGDISMEGVTEGERNATAARNAGHYFALGLGESEVLALMLGWNLKNLPPLPEKEIIKVVESISQREARSRTARIRGDKLTAKEIVPWHEERKGILTGLGAKLGINLLEITKVTGSDPLWTIDFGNSVLVNLTSEQIFSQPKFRAQVFSHAGVVLPQISNKKGEWDRICQEISNAADWKEGGEESTKTGELRRAIEDYFISNRLEVWESTAKRPPMNYPFIYERQGYIFSSHLLHYLQNNKYMKIALRELAQRLTAMKFKNIRKKLAGFDLKVWEVPVTLMPPLPAPEAAEDNVVAMRF